MTKVPLSFEMLQYIEAHKREKSGKDEKSKLRPIIIPQLELLPDYFKEIQLSYRDTPKIDDEKLYKWLKLEYPEKIDRISKLVIDYEKLESLIVNREIDESRIPTDCFQIVKTKVINVKSK